MEHFLGQVNSLPAYALESLSNFVTRLFDYLTHTHKDLVLHFDQHDERLG